MNASIRDEFLEPEVLSEQPTFSWKCCFLGCDRLRVYEAGGRLNLTPALDYCPVCDSLCAVGHEAKTVVKAISNHLP